MDSYMQVMPNAPYKQISTTSIWIAIYLIIIILIGLVVIVVLKYLYMPATGTVKLAFGMTWLPQDANFTRYEFDRLHHPTGRLRKKITSIDDIVIDGSELSIPKLGNLFDLGSNLDYRFYPHGTMDVSNLYIGTFKDHLRLQFYDPAAGTMTPVNWNDYKMLFRITVTYW